MKKTIKRLCKRLEKEYNIKILFAIENGSRAWRISSKDSDYDVRFVFHRKVNDYLLLNKKPDVIERDFQNKKIDMVGFDIFKFCRLLNSSNPTCIEWLITDIVYYGKQNKVFKNYALNYFNPIALYHHYKSMCKNNYLKYLATNNNVTYKRYLYCLRGLMNARYVQIYNKVPSIDFLETAKIMKDNDFMYNTIQKIIKLKKKGKEVKIIDRITSIDLEIKSFINEVPNDLPVTKKSIDVLNKEIQKVIKGGL